MNNAVKIRSFEAGDLPGIMEVYRSAIWRLAAPYYTPEQLEAWAPKSMEEEIWRRRIEAVVTSVAEGDDGIQGFISYEHNGRIDLLFTHPNYARTGVASRLYEHVESELRGSGVRRVFAEASLASRPFFERHGFAVVREEVVVCRGVGLRRFAMRKAL